MDQASAQVFQRAVTNRLGQFGTETNGLSVRVAFSSSRLVVM